MSLRDAVKTLLRDLSLSESLADHVEKSFQKSRPAYHNEEHCYSTTLTFYELANDAGLDPGLVKNGVVAALYHDAHYPEDKDDSVNISQAVQWYQSAPESYRAGLSDSLVTALIKSTLNTLKTFDSKAEALIHDSDTLQTVKSSVEEENAEWRTRLNTELGISVTRESSLVFARESLVTDEAKALLELASNFVD